MDFFEKQSKSKSSSRFLVLYLILSIFVVAWTTAWFINFISPFISDSMNLPKSRSFELKTFFLVYETKAFWSVLIFLSLVTFVKSLFFGNGDSVATQLGGKPIRDEDRDPLLLRLKNVTEEMSIAAGIPIPKLYVLPNADEINAFAAGRDIQSSVVGVTQGALIYLNREQLQALVAHEMSHILNEDTKKNMDIGAAVFGLMMIHRIGEVLLRQRTPRRSSRNGTGIFGFLKLAGLGFFILGGFGTLLGRWIQSLFCIEREFLADASATQYTRNPEALAQTLTKASLLNGKGYEEVWEPLDLAHFMFFPRLGFLSLFFETHPPLEKRIQSLFPAWDKKQIAHFINSQPEPKASISSEESPAAKPREWHSASRATSDSTTQFTGVPNNAVLKDSIELPDFETQVLGVESLFFKGASFQNSKFSAKDRFGFLNRFLAQAQTKPWEERQNLLKKWIGKSQEDGKTSAAEQVLLLLSLDRLTADNKKSLLTPPRLHQKATEETLGPVIHLFAHRTTEGDERSLEIAKKIKESLLQEFHVSPGSVKPASIPTMLSGLRQLQTASVPYRQNLIRGLWKTLDKFSLIQQDESDMLKAFCHILRVPIPPTLLMGEGRMGLSDYPSLVSKHRAKHKRPSARN